MGINMQLGKRTSARHYRNQFPSSKFYATKVTARCRLLGVSSGRTFKYCN